MLLAHTSPQSIRSVTLLLLVLVCLVAALVGCGPGAGDPGEVPPPDTCGNGLVDVGEDCDDGDESSTCDADCTVAECGDDTVNAARGEDCDAGGETALCNADCTAADCGDGKVNASAGEGCDDGNELGGDGCSSLCQLEECGNGVVDPGEVCDEGAATADCDPDCSLVECGDGVANAAAGEECDDGGESATCNATCTLAVCGDGVTNLTAGEECDDMNEDATDACDMCAVTPCTVEYALAADFGFTIPMGIFENTENVGSMVLAYSRDSSGNIVDGPVSTLYFWAQSGAYRDLSFYAFSFMYNMFTPTCGGVAEPDPLNPPATCPYDGNQDPVQTGTLSGNTITWDACAAGSNYWVSSAFAPTLDDTDTANFSAGPGCLNGVRWSGEYTCTESVAGTCGILPVYLSMAVGNHAVEEAWNQPFVVGSAPGMATLTLSNGGAGIASPLDGGSPDFSHHVPDLAGQSTYLRFTGTAVVGPNTTCNLP